jgi:PAS domain S-box-containing protein
MHDHPAQPNQLFLSQDTDSELRLLLQALNSSQSGIIITDNTQPDNPIIFCNEAFETMTGYQRAQIIGHNCRFLQGDDRDQAERDILKNSIKAGEDCKVEIRNYRQDGALFYNELYVSPVKDAAGNVSYFIGVQNDITRRRRAEETLTAERDRMKLEIIERTRHLRENEEYLASIIETVRESLLVLSPELSVIGVNQYFLKAFKVSQAEVKGKTLFELGSGQWDIPRLKTLLHQVLPTSNPVLDFEVEHDFPYIGKRTMLLNAYRVELEGAYKDRILLAIEDITERKAIEQRKDDFLSIASHELKTPLTAIKGYIQVAEKLLSKDTNPKLSVVLGKTQRSIDRLNGLISELLDVTRIQSGKVTLQLSSVDFDKLVTDTVDEFRLNSPGRKIEISGQSNSVALIDEGHIAQVINNLLSNATKYSGTDTAISIFIGRVGDFVKFSVTDQGLGIKFEDQKYIFERFFRAQNIQMKYPGMGIGLYICDQIVRNHEGTLWVESKPGEGSTFSFTLPINANDESPKGTGL